MLETQVPEGEWGRRKVHPAEAAAPHKVNVTWEMVVTFLVQLPLETSRYTPLVSTRKLRPIV